jgi:hypothetical protein
MSIQVSGGTPTFPAQWSDGLCRAHPGDEFCFCHRRWRIKAGRTGRADFASASLTSATDARPTRFCRTQQSGFANRLRRTCPSLPKAQPSKAPFVCAPLDRSRETRPAIALAPDAAASTASRPAFLTIRIRPSCGTGWRISTLDLG